MNTTDTKIVGSAMAEIQATRIKLITLAYTLEEFNYSHGDEVLEDIRQKILTEVNALVKTRYRLEDCIHGRLKSEEMEVSNDHNSALNKS